MVTSSVFIYKHIRLPIILREIRFDQISNIMKVIHMCISFTVGIWNIRILWYLNLLNKTVLLDNCALLYSYINLKSKKSSKLT